MKAAGLLAHNRRLAGAVNARNTSLTDHSKRRSMGLAEAKMTRLRRKVRAVNPRLAMRRVNAQHVLSYTKSASSRRFTADTSRLRARSKRLYKRDSRGRFARR
jgi:hypothetical protein